MAWMTESLHQHLSLPSTGLLRYSYHTPNQSSRLEPNPQFPLDTCPLRCGSDPVLLRRPPIPTGCDLSPPRRSTLDSWLSRQRSSHDNHIITHDRSYRSVLLKTITWSVPNQGISRRACVCLFFEICVLVSTRSVLFWKVTGCCLLFRRLTSCLLCAKFSWIAASCSGICQI